MPAMAISRTSPIRSFAADEGAGIIEQVGAAVADLDPGDPVVIRFRGAANAGLCWAERPSYCERARRLKSSGCCADGSIPMSRNGEPVYCCFLQYSYFRVSLLLRPRIVAEISAAMRRSKC